MSVAGVWANPTNQEINWWTEIIGGISIFVAMSYIVLANPAILAEITGPHSPLMGEVLAATCLTAAVGSLLMGVYANSPSAMACGMGLNSFMVAYANKVHLDWRFLLVLNFIAGLLLVLFSLPRHENSRSWRHDMLETLPDSLSAIINASIAGLLGSVALRLIAADQAHALGGTLSVFDYARPIASDGALTPTGASAVALAGILAVKFAVRVLTKLVDHRAWYAPFILGPLQMVSGISFLVGAGFVYWALRSPAQASAQIHSPATDIGEIGISFLFTNLPSWPSDPAAIYAGAVYVMTVLFVFVFDVSGTPHHMLEKSDSRDADIAAKINKNREERVKRGFICESAMNMVAPIVMTSPMSCYMENMVGKNIDERGVRTGIPSIIVGSCFAVILIAIFWDPESAIRWLASIPRSAVAPMLLFVCLAMGVQIVLLSKRAAKAAVSERERKGVVREQRIGSAISLSLTLWPAGGLSVGLAAAIFAVTVHALALGYRKVSNHEVTIFILAILALVGLVVLWMAPGG